MKKIGELIGSLFAAAGVLAICLAVVAILAVVFTVPLIVAGFVVASIKSVSKNMIVLTGAMFIIFGILCLPLAELRNKVYIENTRAKLIAKGQTGDYANPLHDKANYLHATGLFGPNPRDNIKTAELIAWGWMFSSIIGGLSIWVYGGKNRTPVVKKVKPLADLSDIPDIWKRKKP